MWEESILSWLVPTNVLSGKISWSLVRKNVSRFWPACATSESGCRAKRGREWFRKEKDVRKTCSVLFLSLRSNNSVIIFIRTTLMKSNYTVTSECWDDTIWAGCSVTSITGSNRTNWFSPVIGLSFQIPTWWRQTHIIERSTVFEHEQDVIDELLRAEVMQSFALVQFPADHRQVDGPLDDLVVVPGLEHIHRLLTF